MKNICLVLILFCSGCALVPKENLDFCSDSILAREPKISGVAFNQKLNKCLNTELENESEDLD